MIKNNYLAFLSLLLLFCFLISIAIGAFHIPIPSLIFGDLNISQKNILFEIRIPRSILAILVGASLAICGAVLQSFLKNPLADPGLIGISSSSALFAAFAIIILNDYEFAFEPYLLMVFSFIGGLCACGFIFYFSKLSGSFSVTFMLLIGIAINVICGSITSFLTYFSNDQELRALTMWAMGSLAGSTWSKVLICGLIVIPAILFLIKKADQFNVLLLGEDNAKSLGIDVLKLKYITIICVSLMVGICVSMAGIIGFIGLVVPHLVRLIFGANNKFLIPASALIGAILLLLADLVSRIVIIPAEMPVGIITGLVGGPFFLWLLFKQYRFQQ